MNNRDVEELIEQRKRLMFKQKALNDYEEAIALMDAVVHVAENMHPEMFLIATPVFKKHMTRINSLLPDHLLREYPEYMKFYKHVCDMASNVTEFQHGLDRRAKLIKRRETRPADIVQQGTMCSRCNKRPRKFDDLCGRCAEETGVRPKGKV